MTAAMYLPFLVLLIPHGFSWISTATLMTGGHIAMLFTMAAAMLIRRSDYQGAHAR
jgi:flagellar biosynthetic protein FliP